MNNATAMERRVLLHTVTAKDAAMIAQALAGAGVETCQCVTLGDLAAAAQAGAGAILIAEERFADASRGQLVEDLQTQPPWSDLPVLVLARSGANSRAIAEAIRVHANVTVMERPMAVSALVSAVGSALRARERQYELRDMLADLREADQRKTEFLATLAHELRNPLAPLSTALAVVTTPGVDDETIHASHALMGRQIEHMVRLIDDLMEVSRITRGKIELRRDALELQQVVRDAVDLSRPLIDARRHALDVRMPAAPLHVRGDAVRLSQVFANLLNNAAKYTPLDGHVAIALRRGDDGQAEIAVSDDGIGVEPAMIDAIFGMFVQVSGHSRAAQGGLGIGLTLVKSLVDLHGGSVVAHSDGLGLGTTVCVRLPLAEAIGAPTDTSTPALPSNLPRRVLVVDDNRDAADAMALLLQTLGAQVWVAYSGRQALEVAAEHRPDAALLDIGMPGMDGCELAELLRADPRQRGLLLIALTGWGQPDDKERIAASGFHHHFLKPLDVEPLLRLLLQTPPVPAEG